MEIRCAGTMHARLVDENHIEFRCGRRRCGHEPGVVVLHTFDLRSGEYTTRLFANPTRKVITNGAQ